MLYVLYDVKTFIDANIIVSKFYANLDYKIVIQRYCQTSNIGCTSLITQMELDHCLSNYIFILNRTHGFNGLSKNNCQTRRESYCDLVQLILEIYSKYHVKQIF